MLVCMIFFLISIGFDIFQKISKKIVTFSEVGCQSARMEYKIAYISFLYLPYPLLLGILFL